MTPKANATPLTPSVLAQQVNDLSKQVAELKAQRVTYMQAPVTAVNKPANTFTAQVTAQADGATVSLAGIASPAQFLPVVGNTVTIALQGAQPVYQPAIIAPGAVSPVEVSPNAPAAPAGLTLSASSALTSSGAVQGQITATWTAPTLTAGGSALAGTLTYSIQYRVTGTTAWTTQTATATTALLRASSGLSYDVQVAAIDQVGNVGAYTAVSTIVAGKDTTPPATPTAPTVGNYLGQLQITWDGALTTGAVPADFAYVEVHVSATTGFTPSTATLVSQLSAAGSAFATAPYGTTTFAKLIARDFSGNPSTPSAQGSGATSQVVGADILAGAVAATQLASLSVTTAKLVDASVVNAKIAAGAVATTNIVDTAIISSKIATGAVGSVQIADASVINAKIGAGAVGTTNIASAAITTALIGNLAVGTAQIADAAISTAKVATAAIGSAQIASLGVQTANIADGAIVNAKIGSLAVNTANIASAAITTALIGDLQVATGKIADAAISTAKIGNLAVGTAQMADLSVATAKIADAAVVNAKIGSLAVNDAQIGAVAAGKITAGTMSAAVTISGRFCTALTGARTEMNNLGFQKFDSGGNLIVSITGTQTLLQGNYKTASTGRRIEINSAGSTGALDFFSPSGQDSYLTSYTEPNSPFFESIQMSMNVGGHYLWNAVNIDTIPQIAYHSNWHEFGMVAGSGKFQIGEYTSTASFGTGLIYRLRIDSTGYRYGAPGGLVLFDILTSNSRIRLMPDGDGGGGGSFEVGATLGTTESPRMFLFQNDGGGATFKSASSVLSCRNINDSAYITIGASGFTVSSDAEGKANVVDATVDGMATVRALRVRSYQRILETTSPPGPQGPGGGGPPGPPPLGPPEIGLVAQEAPAAILAPATGPLGIDLYAYTTVLAAALQQLDARVTTLEKKGPPTP